MAVSNIELQDTEGNVYHLKTTAANVAMADGKTIESKMAEIAAGSVLDFDILCSSKGCRCATIKNSNSYTETITKTATAKKAAVRTTTTLSNGYKEVVTFYGEDGVAVMETRTKTTTKTGNGFTEGTV